MSAASPTERDSAGTAPSASRRAWDGAWLPAAVGFLCFVNTLSNDFTYDDQTIVKQNPRVQSLAYVGEIWLTDWWDVPTESSPIVDPARDRLYRPLTLLSFALNYAVSGADPLGFHLVNALLHAGACALLWWFALRLFGDRLVALIAALVFAVHPVHCEAVAGIVGRAEVLSAMFMLAGLIVLLPPSGTLSLDRTSAAAGFFLLALFSKETAICAPLVALLMLHFVCRDALPNLRWWAARGAILALPAAVYLAMRFIALDNHLIRDAVNGRLFNPLVDADAMGRVLSAFTILGHYARLLIAPATLSCDYGLAIITPAGGAGSMTLLGFGTLGVLLVALLGYRQSPPLWRQLACVTALFLASYVLISNTILLIGVSLAERLMYWPSAIVCLAIGLIAAALWRRVQQSSAEAGRGDLLRLAGIGLLIVLAARSVMRNTDWRSDEALFTADAATYPQGVHLSVSLARNDVAAAVNSPDRADRVRRLISATQLLDRALEIEPRYPVALQQRGLIYAITGDREKALVYLNRAHQLDPTDIATGDYIKQITGEDAAAEQRISELRSAIDQDPQNAQLYVKLGDALVSIGQHAAALSAYRQAVDLAPDDVTALRGYAEALLLNRLRVQATPVLEHVLELAPDDWQTHANLSQVLSDSDPQAAFQHARRAHELNPSDIRTRYNLAEAYVLIGNVPEALQRLRTLANDLKADDPFRTEVETRIRKLSKQP